MENTYKKLHICYIIIAIEIIAIITLSAILIHSYKNKVISNNEEYTYTFIIRSYNTNVVYNKKTKVMYSINKDGIVTLLVNPDGTPMIYEGETK